MPQKLNKAGQMQDYIPKGNGDASGEYGTSNGTNKNFTTSENKKTQANVITENKSVVVENKEKNISFSDGKNNKLNAKVIDKSDLSKYDKQRKEGEVEIDGEKYDIYSYENGDRTWGAEYGNVAVKKEKETPVLKLSGKAKSNKANVIDDDLTGKEMVDKTYRDKNGNPKLIEKYKDTKLEDIKKIEAPSYEDISKITQWDRNNVKNNEKYKEYRVKLENAMREAQLYEFYGNQTKQEEKEIKEYRNELNDKYNKLISNHLGFNK